MQSLLRSFHEVLIQVNYFKQIPVNEKGAAALEGALILNF